MLSRSLILLGLSVCFTSSYASSCSQLASTLNRDIQKGSFIEHPPAWLTITSLQKRLGKPSIETIGNRMVYRWKCSDEDNTFLRFVTDQSGRIIHISGIYNDDNGSGMFAAAFMAGGSSTPVVDQTTTVKTKASALIAQQPMQAIPHPTPNNPVIHNNQTSPCITVYNQINADIKRYGKDITSAHLPWMLTSWLTKQLGNPVISPITQTYYQWNQFSVFDDGLGGISAIGTLPNGASISPFEKDKITAYVNLLGKPLQTKTASVNQYQWQCGQSTLGLVFDKGQLLSINAKICYANNQCSFSQQTIKTNQTSQPFVQQAKQEIQSLEQQTDNAMMSSYNQHYQTNLTTQDQLEAAMADKVQQFYSVVRSCQPGTYTYPKSMVIDIVFPSTVISGMQNGKCALMTTFQFERNKITIQCQLPPQTLALYTDQQAKSDLFNAKMDALNTALQTECQHSAQAI